MYKIFIFINLLVLVTDTLACNGYKLKVVSVENCAGDDAIVKIDEDFKIKLNKKCELVPEGCITHKAFATAEGKYTMSKDGAVLKEGKSNICDAADHAKTEQKNLMRLFAMPNKCPVEEGKVCANDHRADISKFKGMLMMAVGKLQLNSTIKHDTGNSCFNVVMEVSK